MTAAAPRIALLTPTYRGDLERFAMLREALEAWGWMLCDGRPLDTHLYPELFATLGYLYGGSGASLSLPLAPCSRPSTKLPAFWPNASPSPSQ